MKTIRFIYLANRSHEGLEKMISNLNSNLIIPGTVDFGITENKKTKEREFYYVAYSEI